MPSATFNEFQRELNKRNIDPQTTYMLTLLYERFGQVLKEQEEMAKMMVEFANQLAAFVNLNEAQKKHIMAIALKVGAAKHADVRSVGRDPNDIV